MCMCRSAFDDGARIAVRVVPESARPPVEEVRFVLFDKRAYDVFGEVLGELK